MGLYWILVAVLIAVAYYATSQTVTRRIYAGRYGNLMSAKFGYEHSYNLFILFFLILMWFLTAFRGISIGNDTATYVNYFNSIKSGGVYTGYVIELGYQYLNLFIGYFTDDPHVFLIIVSTICYVSIGIYIFKFSKNKAVSLVLVFCFCFSNFVNILRQDLAMIIVLYAYQLIKHKHGIVAFLLILLAAQFHTSAYVALLYFIYKLYPRNLIVGLIIAGVLLVLSVSGVLNTILGNLLIEYQNYFYGKYAQTGYLGISVELIRNFFIFLMIHKVYSKSKSRKDRITYANAFILLIFSCLSFTVNLFTRACAYFVLPCLSELPNAFYENNRSPKKYWLAIFCILLLVYFIVTCYLRPEWNNLWPYEFWS